MVGIHTPELVQVLPGTTQQLALVRLLERLRVDRQPLAQVIEQRAQQPLALCRRERRHLRQLGPELLLGCQLRQPSVVDAQQAGVFQVRLDHPAAPPQVLVEPILGEVTEGTPHLARRG
ncbi:hypothetical protein HRbin26_02184 [bacterium HR26]|nr:hypothetical protein HRbin26_02184 [bacterium HR26]